MTLKYNPFNEQLWQDPWSVYKTLRNEDPVYYIEELDAWALTRFADIWNASMDRENFTATHGTSPETVLLDKTMPPEVFLFMDPPNHHRHRGLIANKYAPNFVATLEDNIRNKTREILKPCLTTGELDVYAVASKVALHTIADFIGLEYQEIEKIRKLINIFYLRKPGHMGTTEEGFKAFAEARLYILELLEKYRQNPPADSSHIHTWLHANIDNRAMDQEALFFSIAAMTITGSDTLPLTTAATIYYLSEAAQLATVRENPALIPSAFAEAARFDQPTNILGRVLNKDMVLGGKTLKKGQAVLFLYASANRDEAEFDRADEFLIHRNPKRNLSFGTGVHFCLGQHLAKLEGKIILEEIFNAIDEFEVDKENSKRIFGEFLQGFCSLPIHFSPVG